MEFPKAPMAGAGPRQKAKFVDAFGTVLSELQTSNPTVSSDDLATLIPLVAQWLRLAPAASVDDWARIASYRRAILHVVRSSGVDLHEFYQAAFGRFRSIMQLPRQYRFKYALAPSIDHVPIEDLPALAAESPLEATLLSLQLLEEEPVSVKGLQSFNAALQLLGTLPPVALPLRVLGILSNASFLAGYGTIGEKYQCRRALSELARRMLADAGYLAFEEQIARNLDSAGPEGQAPRVLVVAERFAWGNDLHRCFAAAIASLKEHLHVTLVCDVQTRCAEHAEIAHAVRYLNTEGPDALTAVCEMAVRERPDIIFYPSVAMSPWSYALANIRLAPVQVASTGTPGPVGSPMIDYQAMQAGLWNPGATQFEQPLLFEAQPQGEGFYDSEWFATIPPRPKTAAIPAKITVAINSSAHKLNAEFMACVQAVVASTTRPIQLEFFPGRTGIQYSAVRRQIQQWFPQAIVHPALQYRDYVSLLSGIDIVLQSFPFGGTNTTLEALILGIPIVCMAGPELHSTVDMEILKRWRLQPDLLAASREDYVRIAARLIEDDDHRAAVSRLARHSKLESLDSATRGKTLGDAFHDLLERRPRLALAAED